VRAADEQLSRHFVLRHAGMTKDVHHHVELADLEVQRRELTAKRAHNRLFRSHQRNPVAEARIVPGEGAGFAHARSRGAVSTGSSAFFQAPKPPSICMTGSSPMSCAVLVANAERSPPAQKKMKVLPLAKIGL